MKKKSVLNCANCNLNLNQKPLLDFEQQADVVWVGLSSKKVENIETAIPLQDDTNTGKIIADIEKNCYGVQFYKTNLVKCLPLKDNGKLRYPSNLECFLCYPNLLDEIKKIKPLIIFLLGNKVSNFILTKLEIKTPKFSYNYEKFHNKGIWYIPIHHPSYIAVYKRKEKEIYIKAIEKIIKQIIF